MVSRRDTLKYSGAAVLGLAAARAPAVSSAPARPEIKVAGYAYDRVQAIRDGLVGLEHADVSFHIENIYSVNEAVFGPAKTYELSEVGLIPYVTQYINNDFRDYTLIPVFISRTFRHRNIFVHVDSGIEKPEDLKGRKVGTPGYGASANTWIRGMLQDQYGVAPDDMQWIETTLSSDKKGGLAPSSGGGSRYQLADDFPLVQGPPDTDESELLLSGGCDALITAITPRAYLERDPRIRQLFESPKQAEQQYYSDTGLFPIMHAVAIRKETAAENPWLPEAALQMYSEAKQVAYANLASTTALKTSLPWVAEAHQETVDLMGEDYWRYGIRANRRELELVMRYTYEQGLVKRQVAFEELFHPATLDT